jgi:AraC-like DNA-binding protein
MTRLIHIPPAKPLRKYISSYLFLSSEGAEEIKLAPPQLSSGMAFIWGNASIKQDGMVEQLPAQYIVPITTKPFEAHSTGATKVVAVKFFPGKFTDFIGQPQDLFEGTTVAASDTDLGEEVKLLHEHMDEVNDPFTQAQLLNEYLLPRIKKIEAPQPFIDWILHQLYPHPELQHIGQLQHHINISDRHLRRLFKEYTGLTAQAFIKLIRFYRAYFMLLSGKYISLTQIAYDAGYFDQSHMIRDFKSIMRSNPSTYIKQQNHPERLLAWEGISADQ